MFIIFDPQSESELHNEDQFEAGDIINIPSLFSRPGQFSLIEDDQLGDIEIRPADLADLADLAAKEYLTTTKPTVR